MALSELSHFSKKVQQIRIRHGLTEQEFAERLGMSTDDLRLVECGERFMSISELNKISSLYNTSIDFLCDEYHVDDCDFEIKELMRCIFNEEEKLFSIRLMNTLRAAKSEYREHQFILGVVSLFIEYYKKKESSLTKMVKWLKIRD